MPHLYGPFHPRSPRLAPRAQPRLSVAAVPLRGGWAAACGMLPRKGRRQGQTMLQHKLWMAMGAGLAVGGWLLGAGCSNDETVGSGATSSTTTSAGGTAGSGAGTTGGTGGGAGATGGAGGVAPCPRPPAADNRVRKVVVSHPYDANGNEASSYEVLDLSQTGVLSQTGDTFDMGRATDGVMAFTPDGLVGIIAQPENQTPSLGVVTFDAQGAPHVVYDHFVGTSFPFYPDSVVIDPSGQHAYVLDDQWRNNGGGVYSLRIACDGTLTEEGELLEAKMGSRLIFLPGDPTVAVLAANDALSSPQNLDLQLLDWQPTPSWVAGVDVFPDDEAIIGSMALTPDGRYALLGDNSIASSVPNRVGVAAIGAGTLDGVQVLPSIEDPFAIVASPYTNAALVVSGFGNQLIVLSYDPNNAAAPFANVGEVSYQGGSPQLPGNAVMIERGDLRGRVLVTEYNGVRQLTFQQNGTVADHGLSTFGSGNESNVGAIGVQP